MQKPQVWLGVSFHPSSTRSWEEPLEFHFLKSSYTTQPFLSLRMLKAVEVECLGPVMVLGEQICYYLLYCFWVSRLHVYLCIQAWVYGLASVLWKSKSSASLDQTITDEGPLPRAQTRQVSKNSLYYSGFSFSLFFPRRQWIFLSLDKCGWELWEHSWNPFSWHGDDVLEYLKHTLR